MPPKRPPDTNRHSHNSSRPAHDASQAEAGATQAVESAAAPSQNDSSSTLGSSPATAAPPDRGPDSRQILPATTRGRGSASRPIARPRGIGRRSQQGRAELEKAEADRRATETAAHAKETAWRQRQTPARARGSIRGKMRGGYAGETERRNDISATVSGPFSSGEISRRGGARSAPGTTRTEGRSTGDHGGSKVASSSRVKQEAGVATDIHFKQEDGGYVSSDGEDEDEGPKLNVDRLIDLTGDDDGETDDAYLPPVRIQRVEHKERTLVSNTDTSTREKVAAPLDDNRVSTSEKKRGKQRAPDVEITGESHRYKGTYTDSDSDDDLPIKQEPDTTASALAATDNVQSPPTSPEARRRAKNRIKPGADASKPQFQTKEDELEWTLRQRDLRVLRTELRQLYLPTTATSDAHKAPTDEDPRQDKMYLFQLPAILPELVLDAPKSEDQDINMRDVPELGSSSTKPAKKAAVNGHAKPTVSGLVGKLRVHESGKAYLDWGGIPMEVSMGQEANFLQDILILDQAGDRSAMDVDGQQGQVGLAMSMGQVKGKFVAVPEWDKIFEEVY